MGHIIRLDAERHRELRDLLPWYAIGQLDADERARVEAHLANCPECQAELRFEHRLDDEVARMPVDLDRSWSRMKKRLDRDRPLGRLRQFAGAVTAPAPWLGWAAASFLLLVSGVLLLPSMQPASYRTLSAAPGAASGNVVVIFRPDTRERDMRAALVANGARLVDGPTATDGYVLRVPQAKREAALASLRGRADVVMAAPLDPGPAR
jgi:anti-sigma factor RsiW